MNFHSKVHRLPKRITSVDDRRTSSKLLYNQPLNTLLYPIQPSNFAYPTLLRLRVDTIVLDVFLKEQTIKNMETRNSEKSEDKSAREIG